MIFRAMEQDDIAQIAHLEQICFCAPWSEAALAGELDQPNAYYIVAEENEEIIAYAGCWLIIDEAHITNVAVAPDHRRKGIGELIMRRLAEHAYGEGCRSMTLEVRVSNIAAQSLYAKLGFGRDGIRRRFYTDNKEDAVIMWLRDIGPLARQAEVRP